MKWLSVLGKAVGSFFGIGNANGPSPVQKVAELADEYRYTKQEQAEAGERAEDRFDRRAVQDSEDTARIMIAAERSGTSTFDTLVDAVNRLQRPVWGGFFFGAVVGLWQFPDPAKIGAVWFTYLTIYLTALFGGRALFRDLSKAIVEILERGKK